MRFLSVADRELRSAARQKATYRARWVTAALFFVLLVWLLWVFRGMGSRQAGPFIFKAFSVLSFVYCLFISAARTADCISAERREGTLGLLFLTNLNSAEVITGKLCSTTLASAYGLMAIFPMLALPLMMGGISFGYFWRTVLALLNGILFALVAGLLASVLSKRQFTAIGGALGLMISLCGGLMLSAVAADSYPPTRPLAPWLAVSSPLYALFAAEGTRVMGPNRFWLSLAAVAGLSLAGLSLTIVLLACTWRDRAQGVRAWSRPRFWRRSAQMPSPRRAGLRRRLLGINPLFWLASRQQVSAPVFMVLAVVLVTLTVYVAAPYFGRVMMAGTSSLVVGHLFSWLWAGLAIHALVLYYAAMTASQRLAEDRQNGALELILSTPTSEQTLSRGLWLAYGRKMLFPVLLAILVHVFFVWMALVLATLEPPGPVPFGTTPGELFWSALLDQPLRGRVLYWQFGFMLRIVVLILLQLMVAWVTLGWVGRWLGLRMKHPGFAPIASLALLFAPPILLFTLACYLADKWNLTRLPERRMLPAMMWLAVAIGMGHCLGLSVWARTRLRYQLRAVAMSRYQPLEGWRWRLPTWRAVRPFVTAAALFVFVVATVVAGHYGYAIWRSNRAWRSFQAGLSRSGQSLELAPRLPALAPDDANLARAPVFLSLLNRTNPQTRALVERMKTYDLPSGSVAGVPALMEWSRQTNVALGRYAGRARHSANASPGGARVQAAAALWQDLESHSGTLSELAAAAARIPAFQTVTNRNAMAVLGPVREPTLLLERLHLLFEVRACAALALGRDAAAADDVLAGLHLAQLARQLPDAHSSVRVQTLLARSLQPVWEGLRQQAWTEPQLAALQRELAGFDLLADYSNAVCRVVLAHIELWRAIPDSTNSMPALPAAGGGYQREPAWRWQPRAWWFQNCLQLYDLGRNTLEQVDVASGRILPANDWSDLSGLPLDYPSQELFQQSFWAGPTPVSVAFVQTSLNQAIVASALERSRLAHGTYPETLDKLVPALLNRIPHDAVSGRPIIYQPLGGGRFILRGVGPNGTDDRKLPVSDDWLWTYPTNNPAGKRPAIRDALPSAETR